ncbi:MAG: agmatine deiminase [Atopobiaceae bacterium]|nr:agmatine deiminase [Atopobiaceae bacterium]
MRTIYQDESTPKADGFWMPGEYEEQERTWILWPHRADVWRNGAKPAQKVFTQIIRTIARFQPVTVGVNEEDWPAVCELFDKDENVRVLLMQYNDSWLRDPGPAFLVNGKGELALSHFHFNAYGGFVDGLYFPWDKDASLGLQIAQIEQVNRYRPDDYILEGGSFNCDGQGTVVVTEMCLLNEDRNPQYTKEEIEGLLGEYLGIEKVIWIKDGIDPYETNGHVDDVACFSAPGEVCCMWTDDPEHKFYKECQEAFKTLSEATDAKGRKLKIHKVIMPSKSVYMTEEEASTIDLVEGSLPRTPEDAFEPSYLNFLPINGAVLVPQFGDPNDAQALEDIQAAYPDREVIGIYTKEVIFGGGNIHCITQQQPKVK